MEVGQAHDGSLGTAHAFIDLAADLGADAIKFQTHIASAESTSQEPFRVKFSRQDSSRYAYWQRMEFTLRQWQELAAHAGEQQLVFLSSPFSVEAVELLEECKVPAWKLGSGEIMNTLLFERILQTGKPVLLSSGMSNWQELDAATAMIKATKVPLMLYQCTSKYPCPPEEIGLGVIAEMQERYQVPIGLSDHSGSSYFGIAAAALGVASVEVHMTLSRYAFGPDVASSLDPDGLKQLVKGIRQVERAVQHRVGKDAMAEQLSSMRTMFGRSIVARSDLKKGTVLTKEHLSVKKPAGGLPPSAMPQLIGKKLIRDLQKDTILSMNDAVISSVSQ
jgi:N-acetylneuraminate synthase